MAKSEKKNAAIKKVAAKKVVKNHLSLADLEKVRGGGSGGGDAFAVICATQEDKSSYLV